MNTRIPSLLPLLFLLISTESGHGAARIISEHGYDNLIELSNGTCRVVLEPNMGGRVLTPQEARNKLKLRGADG